MTAYSEQATYIGDLSQVCGTIRTDGVGAMTVKDLPVPPSAVLFPKATDTSNARLSTYTGVQGRSLTVDQAAAVAVQGPRDKSNFSKIDW